MLLKEELIFKIAEKPHPQCHASTLVEIEDGIVAAWFGGTREKHFDVGIWISLNLDGNWSKPVEVVNGYYGNSKRYPCWNPVLFQPENGPIMLFYKMGPDPRNWWGMLMTSENGRKTWSKPVKLGEDDKIGHLLGPIKNKPIQLCNGTIICPSSTEKMEENGSVWRVHFEVSRNLGKSWEVIGPIEYSGNLNAIQPSILEHTNGRLQVLCRTREGVIAQSWSSDNGKSWSKIKSTEILNPNSGTDALSLANGRHLFVYNPIGKIKGKSVRNCLKLAISEDGLNWQDILTLENDLEVKAGKELNLDDVGSIQTDCEYSYPAIIQSKDGLVHISYTYQRESIKYVVLDPKKIVTN